MGALLGMMLYLQGAQIPSGRLDSLAWEAPEQATAAHEETLPPDICTT